MKNITENEIFRGDNNKISMIIHATIFKMLFYSHM